MRQAEVYIICIDMGKKFKEMGTSEKFILLPIHFSNQKNVFVCYLYCILVFICFICIKINK